MARLTCRCSRFLVESARQSQFFARRLSKAGKGGMGLLTARIAAVDDCRDADSSRKEATFIQTAAQGGCTNSADREGSCPQGADR